MSRQDKTILGPVELIGGPADGMVLPNWPGGVLHSMLHVDGWHSYMFDLDIDRHRIIARYVGTSTP
jgi:hypothetical protein